MRVLLTIAVALLVLTHSLGAGSRAVRAEEKKLEYAIAIHGGALDSTDELTPAERESYRQSLSQALAIGRDVLGGGGSSLDAVEKVIRFLEDDPQFNAGKGAVFNSAGGHGLDASIMDGSTRACGAVADVKTVKNPISLARLVMTRTRHVLLVSDGADKFAAEMKVEQVDPKYFWTEKAYQRFLRVKREKSGVEGDVPRHMGTVGCAALDKQGNLAAGTSTGGLTFKKYGRVGDSPIVGAGTYADNATCAVSCTGTGEEYIRHAIAHTISARMELKGESVQEAVRHAAHKTLRKGDGGIIAVGRDGSIALDFNTAGMSRGAADSTGRFEVRLFQE